MNEAVFTTGASFRAVPLLRAISLLVAVAAVVVLVGWVFDSPALRSVIPGAVEMKANTAVGLLIASSALFLLSHPPSLRQYQAVIVLGIVVGALGLATLGEYLFGWHLGIDELLFFDTGKAYNVIPGRMSPYSAVGFIAIGVAILALSRSKMRVLLWPAAIIVVGIGALSFIGYLWNASELVTDRWLPPVAVNTALAFLLLGIGLLLANPEQALARQRVRIRLTSVEIKTLIGFAAALLLLLAVGGYTYRANVKLAEAADWISHTQQLRTALTQLYMGVEESQSAQRNYLLTGNKFYYEDYARHRADVSVRLDGLSKLTSDNSVQAQNLETLRPLVAGCLDWLANGIDIYEKRGLPAARDFIATGVSIKAMQQVRATIDQMDTLEEKLLKERAANFANLRQRSLVSLILTQVIATALLLFLFRAIRREIVQRERLAQELQTSHKEVVQANLQMEAANKELESFSYSVSHDLRAPVRAIAGFSKLLWEAHADQLDAEAKRKLGIIQSETQRMGNLIDDLLAFSRLGRKEMQRSDLDMQDMVRNVYERLHSQHQGPEVEFQLDSLPRASGDRALLEQVWANLLSNALKFSAKQEKPVIEVSAICDDKEHTYFVRDNGAGFDPQYQSKLFGVFQRLHRTDEFAGTGVGLALVHRIVTRHGGRIWANSKPNEGATFYFTLSMEQPDGNH